MSVYKTLFLGATAFSCGGAYGRSAAIVEQNITFAPEFTLTYVKNSLSLPASEPGRLLYDGLLQRGLTAGGRIHLMPAADLLAEMMLGTAVFLDSTVMGIRRQDGLFRVDIWSQGGLRTLSAETVIDTTEKGYDRSGSGLVTRQYLCGALNRRVTAPGGEDFRFVEGALPDEMYFACRVPGNADTAGARKLFYERWKAASAGTGALLVSEGQKLLCEYSRPIREGRGDGFLWIPSMQFGDLICAVEEGSKCSISL